MKIDSEKIKELLKYARERHGAPCRVELRAITGYFGGYGAEHIDCAIFCRDEPHDYVPFMGPVERILI